MLSHVTKVKADIYLPFKFATPGAQHQTVREVCIYSAEVYMSIIIMII